MLAWIGPTRDRALSGLVAGYLERCRRLAPVELRELGRGKRPEPERRMQEEARRLEETARGAESVLLTERGSAWTSPELGAYLRRRLDGSAGPTFFLLGGEDGFRPEDEGFASVRLQLSRFTLPHELARVVLLEQIYRALTLVRGRTYHR